VELELWGGLPAALHNLKPETGHSKPSWRRPWEQLSTTGFDQLLANHDFLCGGLKEPQVVYVGSSVHENVYI
jgi:hypothetical protein